jgi:hypothetical protein
MIAKFLFRVSLSLTLFATTLSIAGRAQASTYFGVNIATLPSISVDSSHPSASYSFDPQALYTPPPGFHVWHYGVVGYLYFDVKDQDEVQYSFGNEHENLFRHHSINVGRLVVSRPTRDNSFFQYSLQLNSNSGGVTASYAKLYPQLFASVTNAPEPSTWMLLIAGFGLVGALLRKRERPVVTN